jgi:hypothetical protein
MNTLPSRRVLFGAFELDLTTGELRSTDTPGPNSKVLLREQVFQVLRMLVDQSFHHSAMGLLWLLRLVLWDKTICIIAAGE